MVSSLFLLFFAIIYIKIETDLLGLSSVFWGGKGTFFVNSGYRSSIGLFVDAGNVAFCAKLCYIATKAVII